MSSRFCGCHYEQKERLCFCSDWQYKTHCSRLLYSKNHISQLLTVFRAKERLLAHFTSKTPSHILDVSYCNCVPGQVVIVVNASSFFSGQSDSDTPATLSLTIPASQVASLSHASLHSAAGAQAVTLIPSQTDAPPQTSGTATTSPQTVTFIPQVAENSRSAVAFLTTQQSDNTSQVPVSAAYLATHGQTSNILSMLDSALQASSPGSAGPIIRVGSSAGAVPATDSSQSTDASKTQIYRCCDSVLSMV